MALQQIPVAFVERSTRTCIRARRLEFGRLSKPGFGARRQYGTADRNHHQHGNESAFQSHDITIH